MRQRHSWTAVVVVMVGTMAATRAGADVLPVPDALHHWQGAKDEQHALRSPEGAVLGDQRAHAVVDGARLRFDIVTRFASGDEWDEHGELDLGDGRFRARRFAKTMRVAGKIAQEQHVDFTTGAVRWLVDGVQAERTFTLPPDTYIGPMLAMVLAGVPADARATTFSALVFRPDPVVVPLRVEPARDAASPVDVPSAQGLRVKADLGPIKNVLFASLIPTHYFWFARGEPELVAFRGRLGNGLEVVMTPEAPATTTARVR